MRWRTAWPNSVSEGCFWASFVVILGITGMGLAVPLVLAAGAGEAVDVLWQVTQFAFAGLLALFLLGIVSGLAGNISRRQRPGSGGPGSGDEPVPFVPGSTAEIIDA